MSIEEHSTSDQQVEQPISQEEAERLMIPAAEDLPEAMEEE